MLGSGLPLSKRAETPLKAETGPAPSAPQGPIIPRGASTGPRAAPRNPQGTANNPSAMTSHHLPPPPAPPSFFIPSAPRRLAAAPVRQAGNFPGAEPVCVPPLQPRFLPYWRRTGPERSRFGGALAGELGAVRGVLPPLGRGPRLGAPGSYRAPGMAAGHRVAPPRRRVPVVGRGPVGFGAACRP